MHAACPERWHDGFHRIVLARIFAFVWRSMTLSSMDPPARVSKSDSRARCARCGVAFDCGGASQPLRCWCADMPALPESATQAGATAAGCLCPACYADALAASPNSRGAAPGRPLP
jgi:hypothetical protein